MWLTVGYFMFIKFFFYLKQFKPIFSLGFIGFLTFFAVNIQFHAPVFSILSKQVGDKVPFANGVHIDVDETHSHVRLIQF